METKPAASGSPTLGGYVWGFALSIVCTLAAYIVTEIHINSAHESIPHEVLIPVILALAVAQLVIQLVFFLHLNKEAGPRWQLAVFLSTIGLVLIVVVGSLWIMQHLNYNMTPQQINDYLQDQGSF